MNLDKFDFFSAEEREHSALFLKNGYIIFDVPQADAWKEFRTYVVETCCRLAGLDKPHDEDEFLNNTHKLVPLDKLNALRMGIYEELNKNTWFKPMYYSFGKKVLDSIVGNELAMQNRINLSIQFPHDKSSLLPIHCDFFSGESPYQCVLWMPLVNVKNTKSMFILSPEKNREVLPTISKYKDKGMEAIFDIIKNDVKFLEIPAGKALLFSPNLLHGNIVNVEPETRWSFNVRFKELFTPYNDLDGNEKKIGMFYLPITIKPASKIGIMHKHPQGF